MTGKRPGDVPSMLLGPELVDDVCKQLWDVRDVASQLGVTPTQARRWLARHCVPVIVGGGRGRRTMYQANLVRIIQAAREREQLVADHASTKCPARISSPIPRLTPTEVARFHSKILRCEGSCWLWQGETNSRGYGIFTIYRDRRRYRIYAHRLAYKLATGTDPGDLKVRHKCDTPPCCCPRDLILGTQADNVADAVERQRINVTGLTIQREARTKARLELYEAGLQQCGKCATTKSLDDFYVSRKQPNGRVHICRECQGVITRKVLCRSCNESFVTSRSRQIFCSKKCWLVDYNNRPRMVTPVLVHEVSS